MTPLDRGIKTIDFPSSAYGVTGFSSATSAVFGSPSEPAHVCMLSVKMPDNVMVLDVETTINENKESAPWRKDCKLHMIGTLTRYTASFSPLKRDDTIVIGHNLAFDLPWLTAHPFPKNIWDTQLAAYILSGQLDLYPSLDSLCERYGLSLKDKSISEEFAKGVGADKVDQNALRTYLEMDLINTYAISVLQMREAEEKGMTALLLSQMDALRATIYMQIEGLWFNTSICNDFIKKYSDEVLRLALRLRRGVMDFTNPHHLSTYLYGGVFEYTEKEEVGVYKSGKRMGEKRYRNVPRSIRFAPLLTKPADVSKLGVDESTLAEFAATSTIAPSTRETIADVLAYRERSKQLSTYFIGHRDLVGTDGFVHPSITHVGTRTGRLACSKPNIMNVTSGADIRKCYQSRWASDGMLVEIDYHQLEIAVLAHLSEDARLLLDIKEGVDIHTAIFRNLHGRVPTKDERKQIKRMVFALVYGGGIATMAKQAGVKPEEAGKVRSAFYNRYPGVRKYHEYQTTTAVRNVIGPSIKTDKGYPAGWYMDVSETGRRYMHREYDSKWGPPGGVEFSYTELLNYKVQGTATGDIVPMMLGHMFRVLEEEHLLHVCKPIATIHDSILFDVYKDRVDDIIPLLVKTLTDVQRQYEGTFGKRFGPKLSVGVSKGTDWYNMEEVS